MLTPVWRFAMAVITAGAVAGGLMMSATSAPYQVEISYNCNGPNCSTPGGVWLWIELKANGTGDYKGSDCIHQGANGLNAAIADSGDVTWWRSNGTLTISGVSLAGGLLKPTITVPAVYGHYHETSLQLFGLPLDNDPAQVQVAL